MKTALSKEEIRSRMAPGMAESLAQDAPGLNEQSAGSIAEDRVRSAKKSEYWLEESPEVVAVENFNFRRIGGTNLDFRLFRGDLTSPAPVVLYFHGGGWCSGGITQNEPAIRDIVDRTGWSVAAITYRLAPESPYPAGLEDCEKSLIWLQENAVDLGLDLQRVVLAGASAGGNLALSTALKSDISIAGLLLFYGVFGADFATPSYLEFEENPPVLPKSRMMDLFRMYNPGGQHDLDPMITPLGGNHAGLPPCCLIAAELDVLRSDSELLHDRLLASGVTSRLHIEPGVGHGFINRGRLLPGANNSLSVAAEFVSGL